MPGDLEGSPALTFAPLDLPETAAIKPGTLAAMMERRYEAYRAHVVRPFFRDHFARLDRQIVLVDTLAALNAGPAAVTDLRDSAATTCCRHSAPGRNSLLTSLFSPRIDRVLFAATKADHLHHTSHDRLEAVLGLLVERAKAAPRGSAHGRRCGRRLRSRHARGAGYAGPPARSSPSSARRLRAR